MTTMPPVQTATIEPWFAEIMTTPIQVAKFVSRDGYGKTTWANPATYLCHVTYKQRIFTDAGGKQRAARGRVYMPGVFEVTTDDQITLDDGSSPVVLATETVYDDVGPHHTVVHFE